jgi:KDO2-lipid IV(A) lauroyltransferase
VRTASIPPRVEPFAARAKRFKRAARAWLIELALRVLRFLPWQATVALGSALGAAAFWLVPSQRKLALEHLARAFPELSGPERTGLARATFKHLGTIAGEFASVRQLDAFRHERIEWPAADRAVMDQALARGKGVVFVTGHVGNWELLARYVALEGYPAAVIAKETSDARTSELLEGLRTSSGLRVIWRGREGAAKEMLRALKSGHILGLLIDQDTKVQSVFVPFFGQLAKTPRAAADLALRTGAAVLLGFCVRQATGHYRITMRDLPMPQTLGETAVVELTHALTAGIEAQIRITPSQWVWMHRRWKSQPPSA